MVTALTQSLHLFRVALDLIRKGKRCQTHRRKSAMQDRSEEITHTFNTHGWGKTLGPFHINPGLFAYVLMISIITITIDRYKTDNLIISYYY